MTNMRFSRILMWVANRDRPEGVLELFAVESPELTGDKLEIIGGERESFDLLLGFHGVRGDGQVALRLRVQRPSEQLLAAEVTRFQLPVVRPPRFPTVGRHALQRAPDYEQHLVYRVPFPEYDCALCA